MIDADASLSSDEALDRSLWSGDEAQFADFGQRVQRASAAASSRKDSMIPDDLASISAQCAGRALGSS
jgi:hypothetical protein